MAIELQLLRAGEIIRLTSDERLDFDESKSVLRKLAGACRKRGLDRALLDIRQLPIKDKPLFTPTQLVELINSFCEAGFGRHQKMAVLYHADPHSGARNFASIGRTRGWRVRAFDDFEQALLWLSDESRSQAHPREHSIPIHVAATRRETKSSHSV